MTESEKRSYQSATRQRQADETRQRIMDAARKLFLENGYAATTIDSIASEAGVAAQTVYAAFRSKQGILTGIIVRARFGADYEEIVKEVRTATDPRKLLQLTAKIARQIYDSERAEYQLLRAVPEIAEQERQLECRRFEALKPNIKMLENSGRLNKKLKKNKAHDILWTLTGRDIFHMLVIERDWQSNKYEKWLAETLISCLLETE
ncbi:MAG: TetR/AcrR family transcriptional regulator [Pyrinomonadaceae bacterium]